MMIAFTAAAGGEATVDIYLPNIEKIAAEVAA